MSAAHTPTPWRVITRANYVSRYTLVIGGPSNTPINPEKNEADAAHIVRCVNSHDALVAALQLVRDYVAAEVEAKRAAYGHQLQHKQQAVADDLAQVDAALAAAEAAC